MKKLATFALMLPLWPSLALAESKAAQMQPASLESVQSLTGPLVAGRIDEVSVSTLTGIGKALDDIGRLHAAARRRNDALAASCVEQKLEPAVGLRDSAAKAAKQLKSMAPDDLEALNSQVRMMKTAADRIGLLAEEARACLQINSGQVVSKLEAGSQGSVVESTRKNKEPVSDVVLPKRPHATPVD